MFMGRNTNNGNGVNVNTRLYTSYSDTCMISLGAWNTNLSLKFHPMKGTNADGIREYAKDNSEITSTSLTVDNTTALLTGIKEHIKPALESSTSDAVSVAMGANENRKVLTVSTDGTDVLLSIAVGVNDQGIADASNVLTHKFNKKEYMVGYDPATGTGETINTNADFENFVEKLKDIYNLTAATAHAINYNNALKSNYSNRQAGSNTNSNPGYSAPVSNYSGIDMGDFLPSN